MIADSGHLPKFSDLLTSRVSLKQLNQKLVLGKHQFLKTNRSDCVLKYLKLCLENFVAENVPDNYSKCRKPKFGRLPQCVKKL